MDKARTAAGSSPKRVGKQLRALRRKKGLSLSEVARGTGLSRRELVAYERGKVEIPESDLWVLAGACGVDASELLPPAEVPALAAAPSTIEDTITHLRSGQEDALLNRHLNTLAALRALPPGSQVQLQDSERASMLETLGAEPDTIEKRLVDRMRISPDEAARLRELIVPAAPRYSPLAVEAPAEAPVAAPVEAPSEAAIEAPAEPQDAPAADPWFGGAFSEKTPTGPVDVFQELACLAEPTPLAESVAESVPEAVLVEVPAAAAAAVVHAADAPPIEVAARFDTDGWDGVPWGATASDGSATATGEPLAAREATPWEPPPSAWDAPWANTAAPIAPVDQPPPPPAGPSPLGIVEFVDDYVEPPADAPGEPPFATTTDDAGVETTADLGPWDHEPDPAATSSGFYVDWGTGGAEGESPASPWDPPAAPPASEALAPWPDSPAARWPEPETNGWPEPETNGWPEPETNGWSEPDVEVDVTPISWHPVADLHPQPVASAVTFAVGPAPVVAPFAAALPAEPEPVEEFVTAGTDWLLGNAVPLVEVRGQGGLVMRRADERWALADVTTTPDFALEVEVDFRSGPGFGVLFHASADDSGRMSGYSFDVDPIHEGGSYLIRQWQADRELWNPIARVAAVDPASMHGALAIRIVVVDDTVDASVNGEQVLAVESLEQACTDRNREPATGDRVGIQAWSSSDLVIDTLRVAER